MNTTYNYIKENIEDNLEVHCESFGCEGASLYDFVFNIAGLGACADVTLQTLFDDIGDVTIDDCFEGFKKWGEEVKGEALDDIESHELYKICAFHGSIS